ncbi:universal stress protein UspA-like protein [Mizugakiibacter sediminis]|uniref:Universal stress protein UspA n=1 Tax=Mizugakiibacter sediminis TaxID=1475481 RepID=A0A0K8QPV2_9GAMM|nr:universal stress protein [Mizugakiibacter sediminis]GAP66934.1 universal stress protein UspA-like protein [Mizugakiibacter sediminis]
MFKHILVGFDGSESSRRGFGTALEMAVRLGGALTVMQVLATYERVFAGTKEMRDLPSRNAYESAILAAAQREVAALTDAAEARGVPCRTVLEFAAEPHQALLLQAQRDACDLIVLGGGRDERGGRVPPGRETASTLVRGSIPVLVVGAAAEPAAAPAWTG